MAASQAASEISLGSLILAGGWLMIPLAILSGISIFIFCERYNMIRKATSSDPKLMIKVRDLMYEGRVDHAVALCRSQGTPVARMIEKGINSLGRPIGDIRTAIENVGNLEVSKLESGLPFLATTAGGAPMIGFLGTVIGMVQAFMNLSNAGGGGIDMALLSSGIYTAMITTVAGLIVGIPAYFGYNFLVTRIEKLIFQMEANTMAFIDLVNPNNQHQ
ncbi:MAG: MotA/TolQ/ExbB proton channel family protein [Rikenellaceae bacterium]